MTGRSLKIDRRRRTQATLVSILAVGVLLATPWAGPALGGAIQALFHPAAPFAAPDKPLSAASVELAQARQSISTSAASAAVPAVLPAVAAVNWTRIVTPTPTTTYEAAMVYDAADKEYVLFGGYNATAVTRETWTYSLSGVWTPVSTATGPSARSAPEMAYDGADHYVLLFGGYGSSALSDTWKFSAGKWTKLAPSAHPPATYLGSMAYDAATGHVLLFGGVNATGVVLNTTWSYAGGTWAKVTTLKAPSPRYGAQLGYDAADGYPLLFGGYTRAATTPSDTWNFSGGSWHRIATPVSPMGRAWGGLGYDPIDAKVVLSVGLNASSGRLLSDTWEYGAGVWSKRATTYNPSGRYLGSCADGTNATGVLLYGGLSSLGGLSDLWSFKKQDWSVVHPIAPAPREFPTLAWDAADRYVVLFGGVTAAYVVLGDTWKFSGGVWTPLHPKVAPGARYGAVMVWDGTDGYDVMFGGAQSLYVPGTWSFLHGKWTEQVVNNASEPQGRIQQTMAYDAQDGYVVLFGGYNVSMGFGYRFLSDTWTYAGGIWNPISPFPYVAPSPRAAAQMSYDSTDGYVVLFGGITSTGSIVDDTWIFSSGNWTNVTASTTGAPYGVASGAMIDDTYAGRVVLYGGVNVTIGSGLPYAWSYSAGSWKYLPPSTFPSPCSDFGMAYDPAIPAGVVFGGMNANSSTVLGGAWEISP